MPQKNRGDSWNILGTCCKQAHSCLEAIRNSINISLCVKKHRAHSWLPQSCVFILQLLIDEDMQLKLLQVWGVQSYFPWVTISELMFDLRECKICFWNQTHKSHSHLDISVFSMWLKIIQHKNHSCVVMLHKRKTAVLSAAILCRTCYSF